MDERRDRDSIESLRKDAAAAQALATKALEHARQELLAAEDDGTLADTFKAQALKLTMLATSSDDKVLVVRLSEAVVMWRHAHNQREQQADHLRKHAEWMGTAYRHQYLRGSLYHGAKSIEQKSEPSE